MTQKIDENTVYRTSGAVVAHETGNDNYAVWNRYIPSVLYLNGDGIKLLEYLETNDQPYKKFKGFKRVMRKMIAANLLYSGAEDSYKPEYIEGGSRSLEEVGELLRRQQEERLPYLTFGLFNHTCNLKCPYCVVEYVRSRETEHVKRKRADKIARLKKVIDRVLHFYGTGKEKETELRFNLNGGEILLDWDIVEAAILYIESRYPEARIEYNINTNATLVTEKIAAFIAKRNFKTVGVSFDGYRDTHNKTRIYHNGRGSFDDVLAGWRLFNKHLDEPLRFFQGTLTADHQLDIEKLMEMKNYDFSRARLGVNLLDVSKEEAEQMADLHFAASVRSVEVGWRVMDDYFKTYEAALAGKNRKNRFNFFCNGFAVLPGKVFYYNLDTEQVNLLCHYVTDAHFTIDEVDFDIYHPLLYEKGLRFLERRYAAFKQHCGDCDIAGICRGGCVISGIDSYNRLNEAACAFMRRTWRHYLKFAHEQLHEPQNARDSSN